VYILDTDICIYAMNASVPAVLDRLARVAAEDLNTTSINAAELFLGHIVQDAQNGTLNA
jgi:predicted nucleic acid-binding protein